MTSFSSHEQNTTRSSGLFPLILSEVGIVMENLFPSSVHINTFDNIKDVTFPKDVECENGSDQNGVTQANKKPG